MIDAAKVIVRRLGGAILADKVLQILLIAAVCVALLMVYAVSSDLAVIFGVLVLGGAVAIIGFTLDFDP